MRREVITKVGEELAKYQEIKDILQAEDIDEQCLLDTLEGETDLHEMLCGVAEQITENMSMIAGIDTHIKALQDRKSRLTDTSKTLRNIIAMTMDRAGLKTVTGPLFTLSVRAITPGLGEIDEAEIPTRFFAQPEPKLDKKALLAALKDGEDIPGARLNNGGIGLTIRTK